MPSKADATMFGAQMRAHLEQVELANEKTLDLVSGAMLDVIKHDHLIYIGGTGHSIGSILEGFFRAGGLACVVPLYHSALLPLTGGRESSFIEKTAGLAEMIVDRAAPTPDDIAFVVSNSGVNAVPVELAVALRARGTPVVAVVSLTHLRAAPARAPQKLDEVADYVLDTHVPYGDAAYPLPQGGATAGLSSLSNIYLWNLLLARLAERAAEEHVELPIWTSGNVEGGAERNAALFATYGRRVPAL